MPALCGFQVDPISFLAECGMNQLNLGFFGFVSFLLFVSVVPGFMCYCYSQVTVWLDGKLHPRRLDM